MKKNRKGFTLAELLIVVAIIGVLVAVSIPIFTSQLEKNKQATDLANMRSAKAAAVAEWMTGDMSSGAEYVYDAASGKAYKSTEKSSVAGYGKSSQPASSFSNETVSGTPNENGSANFVTVIISNLGAVSFRWGAGTGFGLWSSISGTTIESDKWWNNTQQRKDSFYAMRANATEEQRKSADQEILKSLATYFDGKKASDVKAMLGESVYNNATRNNSSLFQYSQDGGGSIRFNIYGGESLSFLKELGYDPGIYINKWEGSTHYTEIRDDYVSGGNNYVNQYLFTSDEMLGTEYQQKTEHNIMISFKVDGDTVTNTKVWVNGLNNQGFSSDAGE